MAKSICSSSVSRTWHSTLASASTSNTTLTPMSNSQSRVPSIRSFTGGGTHTFNTVVLGAGGVGKSALVMRFMKNTFLEQYDPTIEDEYSWTGKHEGKHYRLQITDTAGVEQFGVGVKESQIQRGVGFVLVFSLTEKATLKDLDNIREQIYRIKDGDEDIPMVVVGTKMDLRCERQVSSETMQELSMKWGVPFYETSAKKGWYSSEVFHYLLGQMRTKYPGGEPKIKRGQRVQCAIM